MEYNEIPSAIKNLTGENTQISYAVKHDLPRYKNEKGKIKALVGDRAVWLNVAAFETLLTNQMVENDNEIARLEGIHDTLTKVAVGLIK